MLNSRDISLLRPDVSTNCRHWLTRCHSAGLQVLITNTVRDQEYQAYLYAQGRTRPGQIVTNGKIPTFHSDKAGLAFDFCKNIRGHEYDDPAFFQKAADLAKEMGFSWGGDWKSFPDLPHIQWDSHGKWNNSMIRAGTLPPTMPLWHDSTDNKENTSSMRYQTIAACPTWAQATLRKLVAHGLLGGGGQKDAQGFPTDLDLSLDMLRLLVVNDRAGLYDQK